MVVEKRSPWASCRVWFVISVALCTVCLQQARAQQATEPTVDSLIGRTIDSFAAADFRGKQHTLADYQDRELLVIAFLGTECPLAKLYGPRLQKIADDYGKRGVTVLGINSNSQDSITEIAAFTQRHAVSFPMLKDTANRIADQFGAERTPEVFVLDRQRRICYHGRIDDQYGVGFSRDKPQREDLRRALDQLLAGERVATPSAPAVGCFIGRIVKPRSDGQVTFSGQIAKILQKHCVECHRQGEIAPFALTDYDEVVGWAETIQEVVDNGRMPPWHADSEFGTFANQRQMDEQDKQLLRRWVADGAPRGDESVEIKLPDTVRGWRLPVTPDVVIPMRTRPFRVPAEGIVEYQYFVVDPGFTEDKWVRAAEVIPGNRAVVHHTIVFVRPPEGIEQRGLGWIGGYVPGQEAAVLKEGQARRVPAGSKLVFQMHYTPVGTEQEDITRLGLIFTPEDQVREEIVTLIAIDRQFEIPPFAENFQVEKTFQSFPEGKLLAITPHMHVRGKSFRFDAQRDGQQQTLLSVPHYDFNWQHTYVFDQPIKVDPTFRLRCTATFDNSEDNLVNPDPSAIVRWGDQTWEEMFLAFFEVAIPKGDEPYRGNKTDHLREARERQNKAEDFIKRFDKNQDGRVVRDEVPNAIRTFAFRNFDTDRDGAITEQEARDYAEKHRTQRIP